MMRAKIQQLNERINGLSLRERLLLMLAALAVIFLLWDSFVMNPVRQRQASAQAELEQVGGRIDQVTASIQLMARGPAGSGDQDLLARERALAQEVTQLEQRLDQQFAGAVRPQQAVAVLAGLLERQAGLSVVSLENLPPELLAGRDGEAATSLYVHRIRVIVEGDHASLREYLARVTDLPRGVFLESLQLSVPGWPTNRIELMFYSLTLDDNWLGV